MTLYMTPPPEVLRAVVVLGADAPSTTTALFLLGGVGQSLMAFSTSMAEPLANGLLTIVI
ncbi:MAG: hypothetical protein JO125_03745 [Chloroflexi bacterium]|nr:hypothetical protein [Ktedonobacteraceae bacterium]MBV9706503.1 hypothetical protein [Chloroflexota bacterium]